jgi:hypothetical protein
MAVKEYAVATTGLEPSTEVQELMLRLYEALSRGDFDSVDRVVSRQDGLRWIGTDPTEWWGDFKAVAMAWRTQATAMGGPVRIIGGNATAFRNGDVAWVSDNPAFQLADGKTLPFRFTVVWLREPEGWRIVQAHASFGVANDAVLRTA